MQINDEIIKKDIVDQLTWDSRVNSSKIKVDVDSGKVTLSGSVPSKAAKKVAEDDVYTIHGVSSVINNLEVRYSDEMEIPTDKDIRYKIQSALGWSEDVDDLNIKISVLQGKVILRGTVSALWEKLRAGDIANGIFGVSEVINELGVVPTKDITDEAIAEDIIKTLERTTDIDLENIHINVAEGMVKLSGSVRDWHTYRAIESISTYTYGVKDTINNIRVSGTWK
jgi:osmotically-inducible protein OsmY